MTTSWETLPERETPQEYRKTATVLAGVAPTGGVIHTLEGDHTYEAGDYICGPGAAGEFWPVRRDIFEATYALAAEDVGLDVDDCDSVILALEQFPTWFDGTAEKVREIRARLATEEGA